jgi:hypothetical protein
VERGLSVLRKDRKEKMRFEKKGIMGVSDKLEYNKSLPLERGPF